MGIDPTPVEGDFAATRLAFIAKREGSVSDKNPSKKGQIYTTDGANVPTIGKGFALAGWQKTKGGGKHLALRSDMDTAFAQTGHTVTPEEKEALQEIVATINAKKADGESVKAIDDDMKDDLEKKYAAKKANQPAGALANFTVNDAQANTLLNYALEQNIATVTAKHPEFALMRMDLAGSKELVALDSLIYNSPSLVGGGVLAALREGDRAKVVTEVLYNHQNTDHNGLMNRRVAEALQFGMFNAPPVAADVTVLGDPRYDAATQTAQAQETLSRGKFHNGKPIAATVNARDDHTAVDVFGSVSTRMSVVPDLGEQIDLARGRESRQTLARTGALGFAPVVPNHAAPGTQCAPNIIPHEMTDSACGITAHSLTRRGHVP